MINATEVARAITALHGLAGPLRQLDDGGINHVFVLDDSAHPLIIRFAIGQPRPGEFEIEEWCLNAALHVSIPSPRPIAIGTIHGLPYGIQTFVPGPSGETADPVEAWHRLGGFAAQIARIPLTETAPAGLFSRFGRDLQKAWHAHIRYNIDALGINDPLQSLGVYPSSLTGVLTETFARLGPLGASAGLTHGDLAPRNMILSPNGNTLIDWGAASTGPAPWSDLEAVYVWSLTDPTVTPEHVQSFADGCGINLSANRHTITALSVLHQMDLVRWAAENCPEQLDHHCRRAVEVIEAWRGSTAHRNP